MVSTVDCESASMDSSSIVHPKEDSIHMNWEDIKFPPINLWSVPRLSQERPIISAIEYDKLGLLGLSSNLVKTHDS